jgi:hypothetical protein
VLWWTTPKPSNVFSFHMRFQPDFIPSVTSSEYRLVAVT